jgi:BirA family biotin operon repressor/biotin-[acetyl-CoA-carboxylase] ligase
VSDAFDVPRFESLLHTQFVGRRLFYEHTVTSTMDVARREATAGEPEGSVALAEEQTAGRGRFGRAWVSPPGVNLYFTIALHPTVDELRYLSVIGPLSVCQAIEEITGLQPRIKWPNDVMLDGRKVAGLLLESQLDGDDVAFALVGPGINVNLDVSGHADIREIATSLREALGREVSREELLASCLNHFEALYLAVRRGEVVSMGWKQRLETLGQQVRVSTPGAPAIEGTVVDADSDGAIIVRRDDGAHVRVESGEVTLRG